MEEEINHNNLAPIVLFVYNRAQHTKRTVEALLKNKYARDSILYIFCDGPKSDEDCDKIRETRDYIHSISGFKKIIVQEKEKNVGLSNSIIHGIDLVIDIYGRCIILEDDIETSPYFLEFMNSALVYYSNTKTVFSVSGYSYLVDKYMKDIPEVYCSKISCCWGWATWKDRWNLFDQTVEGYEQLKIDRKLRKEFDYGGYYGFFDLLIDFKEKGRNDSWAIRWYYSIFKNNGLTIYPKYSLVNNIGFDGSGTHCGKDDNEFNNRRIHSDSESQGRFEMLQLLEVDGIKRSIQRSLIPHCIKRWIQLFKYMIKN